MTVEDDAEASDFQRRVRLLGYAGLVPFVVLSLWLYGIAEDHPWHTITIALLVAYSAIVLSFLGGIRWGIAMQTREGGARALAPSLVPALVGWLAPFVLQPYCFAILAVAYAAQGAWDSLSAGNGALPEWYGRMRVRLTIVAVATLVLAFVATA
ncbi:MAG: DUF3429 domain-containing protein [Rhizobiaceae bacterium]|nr:DUF3429 domain-containing protein [Rhizobiaceae bacterium]